MHCRTVSTLCTLALLLAGAPQHALAHGGGPETRSIAVRPGQPADLLVNSTFGLMVSHDAGASWGWVCQQALGTGGFVPRGVQWTGSGRLLAITGPSLVVSPDGGCSWSRHPELESAAQGALDLAVAPRAPETVYVLSADGVRRSTDGAQTFERFAPLPPGLTLSSLELAPSDAARVYAAGLQVETGTGRSVPALWRSQDGGGSWDVVLPDFGSLGEVSDLSLLGVSPADPALLYARAVRGPDELLLRSADGGRSFQRPLTLSEAIEGIEISPDGRTVWLGSFSYLYRSTDGGLTFTQLVEPTVNACARLDGSRLLACGSEPTHGWSLGFSTDAGQSWTALFRLAQLQQVAQCPASSPTAQVCGPLMAGLRNALSPPGSDNAPPTPPPAPKDGCAAGGGALAPGLGLLLCAALRRARNRARPRVV